MSANFANGGGGHRTDAARSRTLRVLQVLPASEPSVPAAYGVAFGTRLYAAADRAQPLGIYTCVHEGPPLEFRVKPEKGAAAIGSDSPVVSHESVWDIPAPARPHRPQLLKRGEWIVAEQVKDGWVRASGGAQERWVPIHETDAGGKLILEKLTWPLPAPMLPLGWEVLRLQDCSQDVLMKVIGGFEWGCEAVAVHDVATGRFVRIGTRKHGRAGDQLGEVVGVSIAADGTINSGGCAILITRRLVGVNWGGDAFDALGLLQDPGYLDAAASRIEMATTEDLELECREQVQRTLVAELRGWFSTPTLPDSQLIVAASNDASALRRLWAARLSDQRYRVLHECFKQLPRSSASSTSVGEGSSCTRTGSNSGCTGSSIPPVCSTQLPTEEEEDDPMQLWMKVALSTVLELASVMPLTHGQPSYNNLERLIGRAAKTLSIARPLSLHGRGPSQALMGEVVRSLDPLMEATPQLAPVCNSLLLAFATATGSSFLAAHVAHGLLRGANETVAQACISGVRTFWQLGSVLHFEVRDTPSKGITKPEEHKRPWQFQALEHIGVVPSKVDSQIRSCLTLPFGEIPTGGVYWEVVVTTPDPRAVSLGVWLAHAQHFVGCNLSDGTAVGLPGAKATPAEELPAVQSGSVMGLLLTDEDVIVSCDGLPFTCVGFREMTRSAGAEAAIFIGQGKYAQVQLNIGQRPLRHLQNARCERDQTAGAMAEVSKVPVVWGHAVGSATGSGGRGSATSQTSNPFAPFIEDPKTGGEVAAVLLGALERNASASVATDGGGSYRFGETHRMQLEPDGMQVKRVNENAWAVVDCELSGADEAEWCFQSIEDLNNDEGTCYGVTTKPPQNSYDRDGWIVIRAYNAHFYVSGSDYNVRAGIQKIHPGSKIHFRLCLAEGLLYAWVNDNPPVEMLRDPSVFVGRTWFPGCFVYGSRATVRLVSCWKSRSLRRPSSFGLEYSSRAVEMWVCILEDVVRSLTDVPRGSAGAAKADVAAAQALRVLVAQMQAAKHPWSAFGGVRERLKAQLQVLIIDRRDDAALSQSQMLSCLLVEGLGVGDLWGGPEEVLGIFLRIRGTDSRVEQTLAEFLLEQQQVCSIAPALVEELVDVAAGDALGGQILLRLATNAFAESAEQFVALARGVLARAARAKSQVLSGEDDKAQAVNRHTFFTNELLPVVSLLLGALLHRDPRALHAALPLLELATKVRAVIRTDPKAWDCHGTEISKSESLECVPRPQFAADVLEGLTAFTCSVGGLLLQSVVTKPFPLDLVNLELRDKAIGGLDASQTTSLRNAQEAVYAAIAVNNDSKDAICTELAMDFDLNEVESPLPPIIADVLDAKGRGETLVQTLQSQRGQGKPVSSSQRSIFAAALLFGGPRLWDSASSDVESLDLVAAWQMAQQLDNHQLWCTLQGLALGGRAPGGDMESFGARIASCLSWIVTSVRVDAIESASVGEASPHVAHKACASPSERVNDGDTQRNTFDLSKLLGSIAAQEDCTATTLDSAASEYQNAACWVLLGLNLLHGLLTECASADSTCDSHNNVAVTILPAMQAALEETLKHPMVVFQHCGTQMRKRVLAKLVALLRDIQHQASHGPLVASALGLGMLCVPLARSDLEVLLEGHFEKLTRECIESVASIGRFQHAHIAALILRVYIVAPNLKADNSMLSGLLSQLATTLQAGVQSTCSNAPLPAPQAADALVVDWDLGSFGRLCPRRLDEEELRKQLEVLQGPSASGATATTAKLATSMASLPIPTLTRQHAVSALPSLARVASEAGSAIETAATPSSTSAARTAGSESDPAAAPPESQVSRYNAQYYCIVRRAAHLGGGRVAVEFEVVGDGSLGSLQAPTGSRLSWESGHATPSSHEYVHMDLGSRCVGTLFYEEVPVASSLTFAYGTGGHSSVPLCLEQDTVLTSLDEVPVALAHDLSLRCPPGADPLRFDAAAPLLALFTANRREPPWSEDWRPLAHASVLTLLRPALHVLVAADPAFSERLLELASSMGGLPGALAVRLIKNLQLSDAKLASWAFPLLVRLGALEEHSFSPTPTPERRGSLVISNLLIGQLHVRADVMEAAVLQALSGAEGVQMCEKTADVTCGGNTAAQAALLLVGGQQRGPAVQMQIVEVPFGRALVVDTQPGHAKVLALDAVDGTQPLQRVRYTDLPIPCSTSVSKTSIGDGPDQATRAGISQRPSWSAAVVDRILELATICMSRSGISTACLRALVAVLRDSTRWDASLVKEAVRELGNLAQCGHSETVNEPVELLEHKLTLLRLAASSGVANPSGPDSIASPKGARSPLASSTMSLDNAMSCGSPTALTLTMGSMLPASIAAMPAVSASMAPAILEALNHTGWWRGKYKLSMGRNTWHKVKWQFNAKLQFELDGVLSVTAVWPQFGSDGRCGSAAAWWIGEDAISIRFSMNLPERREAGRTRQPGSFIFKGSLVRSRECPIFEGRAEREGDECKYTWYLAPPDPIRVLLSGIKLGLHDEDLPETHSVISFSAGRQTVRAGDLGTPLGLEGDFTSGRALAAAAVERLNQYKHVSGPGCAAQVERETAREESWMLRETSASGPAEEDPLVPCGSSGCFDTDEPKWAPLVNMPSAASAYEASSAEAARLRQALLTQLLQSMLAHRPPEASIALLFPEESEREVFFRCATLLPDAAATLERCNIDFASSPEVARDALRVALEGLFAPFVTRQVSQVTVQSDHNYHPNEDWLFCLHIDRASALRVRFDSKCKTEQDSDFLQFFRDEACRERLHEVEKFSGDYPAGWPELRIPGDRCWLKFCSNSSEEHWGWKLALEGIGLGGGDAGAVRFPSALRLLASVAGGVSEDAERISLLASSALLTIAAMLPETPEAVHSIETMATLLVGHPACWSESAWNTALALMSTAEASNRRPLLAAVVCLLSQHIVPGVSPTRSHCQSPLATLLSRVEPPGLGLLADSRTTVVGHAPAAVGVATQPVRAFGFPMTANGSSALPGSGSSPLFRIRIPNSTTEGSAVGAGIVAHLEDAEPVICSIPASETKPGEEFNVFVTGFGDAVPSTAGAPPQPTGTSACNVGQVKIINCVGEQVGSAALPPEWASAAEVIPVLQVQGFGSMLSLLPPPSVIERVDAPAARLNRFKQVGRLITAFRRSFSSQTQRLNFESPSHWTPSESLPPAVVACAWALQEDDENAGSIIDIEERLCVKCTSSCESEHPHLWTPKTQKLEVVGAHALELRFPSVQLAPGHRLKVTYDAEGNLPVLAMPSVASLNDGKITKYLPHGDHLYASLDNVDPDSTCVGTQQSHLPLPEGWEIAPGDLGIVAELIAKHPWGTHVMVCANGNSYSTTLHESGRRAGKLFNTNRLSVQRGTPTKYRPTANQFRILIRRSKPRPTGPSPLNEGDMKPEEHVVVSGSKIYVHGPVLDAARWDTPPRDGSSDGEDHRSHQETGMRPVLCPGPWRWALSPAHTVTVLLQQGGEVKFLKTTLGMLTEAEFEEVEELMSVMGEGAVDPNASWIRSDQFRLAKVTGSWNAARQQLKLRLDGADDLGTAALSFVSNGEPRREQTGVSIAGDVEHCRWGLRTMERDGRASQTGAVVSVWVWPDTHEASLKVEIVEDAGHELQLRVLSIHSNIRGGEVAVSLFLEDGEWLEEVLGDRSLPEGRLRLQVRTNRGQELCWPPGPVPAAAAGRFALKAPAGCEVLGLSMPAKNADAAPELLLRPLDLVHAGRASMQRLPEALWDGSMEEKGCDPVEVTCQLTSTGERGHFEAVLKSRASTSEQNSAASEWLLKAGSFSVSGSVAATLTNVARASEPAYEVRGRCAVAEDQHMHLILFGSIAEDPFRWLRLRLRSSNCTALDRHGMLFTDGPMLIFHAAEHAGQKYTMHTASSPWTKQLVAEDVIIAEVLIKTLPHDFDGRGLILGVGEPRPGGGTAPLGAWPGDRTDRWLWRGDGAVSHGDPAAVSYNSDWAFNFEAGDTMGVAVGAQGVAFLRNSEVVLAVPRRMPGLQGPLSSELEPALIVGLGCDVVLQLASDVQYPHLAPYLHHILATAPDSNLPQRFASSALKFPLVHDHGVISKDDVWVEVSAVGTQYRQSRSLDDTCSQAVGPWDEVVVAEVVDGWLRIAQPPGSKGTTQNLWLPIEKPGVGQLFQRRTDLCVTARPIFERIAEASLTGYAGLSLHVKDDETFSLPTSNAPFTAEVWVKPSARPMTCGAVLIAWGCRDRVHGLNELSLRPDGRLLHSGSKLEGKTDLVHDGQWHHVIVQFDGQVLQIYVDSRLDARMECPELDVGSDGSLEVGGLASGGSGAPSRCFEGKLRKLRIWAAALTPAQLNAYAREAIAIEASDVVFNALDVHAAGTLDPQDILTVLGGPRHALMHAMGCDSANGTGLQKVSRENWHQYCRELRRERGTQALMQFLQAFKRNLEQRLGRTLTISPAWQGSELLAALQPSNAAHGWRVEARPVALTDAMLADLRDSRLDAYHRTLQATGMLFGTGKAAGLAIVQLADQAALQKGSPDDCWAELLAPSDWEKAQPGLTKEAIAQLGLGSVDVPHASPKDLAKSCNKVTALCARLCHVVSFTLACDRQLRVVLKPPLVAKATGPRFEQLRAEVLEAGGSPKACWNLAEYLLSVESTTEGVSTLVTGFEEKHAAVSEAFHAICSEALYIRFLVIREVNRCIAKDFLPLVDLGAPSESDHGKLLTQIKPWLLGHLKYSKFQQVLAQTVCTGEMTSISISKKAATSFASRGCMDWGIRKTVFAQVFRELTNKKLLPVLFRQKWSSKAFKVTLKDESGEDGGGLYHEMLDIMVQELQSRALPLLIVCPNSRREASLSRLDGMNCTRDGWLLNPRAAMPDCIQAFEFLGQLIGLAIRSGDTLALSLAPWTWKGLVGECRTRTDVSAIDSQAADTISRLEAISKRCAQLEEGSNATIEEHTGAAAQALLEVENMSFSYPDITGDEVELIEGGRATAIGSAAAAGEFARLLLQQRIASDLPQLRAVRRGMSTVVPLQLIRLWTWQDLQDRVCGMPAIDLEMLRRQTTCRNCPSTHECIGYFWQALEGLTRRQQQAFLRFVCGSGTIPSTEPWEPPFTLELASSQAMDSCAGGFDGAESAPTTIADRHDDDRPLRARPQNFELILPMYSSMEVCRTWLLRCGPHPNPSEESDTEVSEADSVDLS